MVPNKKTEMRNLENWNEKLKILIPLEPRRGGALEGRRKEEEPLSGKGVRIQ